MTCSRVLTTLGLLALLAMMGAAALVAQAARQSMYVSALDAAGAPVPDLGPSDFVVREDGIAREILAVEPATEPMQVALLVDNSTAAQNAIRDVREAVTAFVTGMTGEETRHEVAIIGLAERPTILTNYTADRAELLTGVGRIFTQPQSGMYLLDAILETCSGLTKRRATRPVIVAVTSEGVEYGNRFHPEVLEALRRASASFHVITFGPPSGNILATEMRERYTVFDEGTRTTGGRYEQVLAISNLPQRMGQVAAELTHQYLVSYARPESLIPPERTTVEAGRQGLTVRGVAVKEPPAQGRP
jgi:VWFA-related protein